MGTASASTWTTWGVVCGLACGSSRAVDLGPVLSATHLGLASPGCALGMERVGDGVYVADEGIPVGEGSPRHLSP